MAKSSRQVSAMLGSDYHKGARSAAAKALATGYTSSGVLSAIAVFTDPQASAPVLEKKAGWRANKRTRLDSAKAYAFELNRKPGFVVFSWARIYLDLQMTAGRKPSNNRRTCGLCRRLPCASHRRPICRGPIV